MEKFKEIYFYIQTEAYKANVNERADPVIVQRFYEETREMFWDLGFTLGRDYALKENSCLQIGVMTFRGNLKEALIQEVEQALKTAETFQYSHYNDYGDTFLLSEAEQETYFQEHLADYEKEVLETFKSCRDMGQGPWMERPLITLESDIVLCRGYHTESLYLKRFSEVAADMEEKGLLIQKVKNGEPLYSLPKPKSRSSILKAAGKPYR